LISQIQPSGGTPLSQLADSHPELDAHPHELKIGYPNKYTLIIFMCNIRAYDLERIEEYQLSRQ
jgi:hypothetical protein